MILDYLRQLLAQCVEPDRPGGQETVFLNESSAITEQSQSPETPFVTKVILWVDFYFSDLIALA
jgi:hypothetical protein